MASPVPASSLSRIPVNPLQEAAREWQKEYYTVAAIVKRGVWRKSERRGGFRSGALPGPGYRARVGIQTSSTFLTATSVFFGFTSVGSSSMVSAETRS